MSKKNTGDKSLVITKIIFDKFSKITNDNIREFFNHDVMFIVAIVSKNKVVMTNSFMVTPQLKKGPFRFHYLWDGNLSSYNMIVKQNESNEDYNTRISDLKSYMKNEIKLGRLYARKI